jgi:hypothetical protein
MSASPERREAAPAGPPIVEVVKVVEQPLNVTLSLPGELTPYQSVALYSRVTGFREEHHGGSRFARPGGPAAGHARGAGAGRTTIGGESKLKSERNWR